MSDDAELPPIVDLASFRAGRKAAAAMRRARDYGSLEASVEGGTLWLSLSRLRMRVGLHEPHVAWLSAWIDRFKRAQREAVSGPDRHRCRTCGHVKWIECRGHRPWGQTRTHFRVEVLERKTWHVWRGQGLPLDKEERPSLVRTSCGREARGSRSSATWAAVTCALCLRKKPRAVP